MKVFVYGTLRRGEPNYKLLREQEFIGEAVSAHNIYEMYGVGVPMLVEGEDWTDCNGHHPVKGEIFNVSLAALANLDRLEGHPNFYCRKEREFLCNDQNVVAWVYLCPPGYRGYRLQPRGNPPALEANRYSRNPHHGEQDG